MDAESAPRSETGFEAMFQNYLQKSAYEKKYFTLRRKCEHLQQANERLVNRIQQVKTILKKYKRERRFLMGKLDDVGDQYKDTMVPAMWEENQSFENSAQTTTTGGPSSNGALSANPLVAPPIPPSLPSFPSLTLPGASSQEPLFSSPREHVVKPEKTPKMKRARKEKDTDPNAPKKPLNAYIMFCNEFRSVVQEEYQQMYKTDMDHHELTKELANRWNHLTQEQKKVYYDKYGCEKERYSREMEVYNLQKSDPTQAIKTETQSFAVQEKPDHL